MTKPPIEVKTSTIGECPVSASQHGLFRREIAARVCRTKDVLVRRSSRLTATRHAWLVLRQRRPCARAPVESGLWTQVRHWERDRLISPHALCSRVVACLFTVTKTRTTVVKGVACPPFDTKRWLLSSNMSQFNAFTLSLAGKQTAVDVTRDRLRNTRSLSVGAWLQ